MIETRTIPESEINRISKIAVEEYNDGTLIPEIALKIHERVKEVYVDRNVSLLLARAIDAYDDFWSGDDIGHGHGN